MQMYTLPHTGAQRKESFTRSHPNIYTLSLHLNKPVGIMAREQIINDPSSEAIALDTASAVDYSQMPH